MFSKCLTRTSVADPDPGPGAFLTPGSGMSKKMKIKIRVNIPDYISDSLETMFWVKILQVFKETLRRENPGLKVYPVEAGTLFCCHSSCAE
jgi:hypothetical protein